MQKCTLKIYGINHIFSPQFYWIRYFKNNNNKKNNPGCDPCHFISSSHLPPPAFAHSGRWRQIAIICICWHAVADISLIAGGKHLNRDSAKPLSDNKTNNTKHRCRLISLPPQLCVIPTLNPFGVLSYFVTNIIVLHLLPLFYGLLFYHGIQKRETTITIHWRLRQYYSLTSSKHNGGYWSLSKRWVEVG